MAGDHFGLGSLSGTGRAEEHESFSFHLAPVEENGHAADDDDGDADVEPHQGRAPRRVTPRITRAVEAAATDATLAQETVVMPLNEVRLDLPHSVEDHGHN